MTHSDRYRDPALVRDLAGRITGAVTRPWTLMEVCGGQTHAIVRFGIDELLPPEVTLVHGPGCPVCVTPVEKINQALDLASRDDVIFCSFGDMLRVPGSDADLFSVKARGGDVRMVYSPLDALSIAEQNPAKQVVFFAVGFETTAPANALAIVEAQRRGLRNVFFLVSQVLVPPAIEAILSSEMNQVQAFLAAGHVCTVMGIEEYRPLAARYGVPIVVTGFEPVDILEGVLMCVQQLETGRAEVENAYARSVSSEGNQRARNLIREVFEVVPRTWRGIGKIPHSGLQLREAYAGYDAERQFGLAAGRSAEAEECISGLILRGQRRPTECPAFGSRCTPEQPLGATMVSSEGACAAYYRYRHQTHLMDAKETN
jgi:hydrogenase expression/formation protein HypD